MISWDDLLKGRTLITPVVNSANMLECVKFVKATFPNAAILEVKPGEQWMLASDGRSLSNPHNSHYACWAEAKELLSVAD